MESNDRIRIYAAWPKRSGKADMLKHLGGERITQRQAIRAKCFDCSGGDGEKCSIPTCPLHPYSPLAGNPDTGDAGNEDLASGSASGTLHTDFLNKRRG